MFPSPQSRGLRRPRSIARTAALGFPLFVISSFLIQTVHAQISSPADNPASIPAGAIPPLPAKPPAKHQAKSSAATISAKQAREADDAYLEGAKHVEHKDLAAAMRSFEQAVHLNPNNSDYSLSLIVTRENYVTELVQRAARARSIGDVALADSLLAQARTLDPNNHVVTQHFETADVTHPTNVQKGPGLFYSSIDPSKFPAQNIASTLSGPVELTPDTGKRSVHLHGDVQSVVRNLYSLYGIKVSFDSSVTGGRPINLDMNNVTYSGATRALDMAAGIFSVPVQPKTVLVAKDTQENRDALMPQVEETIYLPGRSNDEMQQLANVARNIFDIKEVTASATGGYMLLRGNEPVLREVNAVYDDMLDQNPEVLFDVTLYEIDTSVENNVGAALPASLSGFDVLSSAQNLITSNQSLINQAVASGLLTLTGSAGAQELAEVAFLVAAGVSGSSEFTTLLGVVGTDGGLPLAGVSVASGGTFDLGLTSTDVRLVDAAQVRASNRQAATFREGTRYPVVTGTYSSGATSSLASSLSGLNINGTSASSLLSQYLGSSTTTVPEFQYEDLGITLKLTPQVLHNDEVSLAVDMKLEALAGTSLNNIPILNNRALTSTITVPAGKTAMLATLVTTNEVKGLTGLPGLSELPGFQGTEQDLQKSTTELLITVTPHIARAGRIQIASRRLAAIRTGPSSNTGSDLGIGSDAGANSAPRPESGRGVNSGTEPGSSRGLGQGANQNSGAFPPQ
jgi:type II secretory pathway component GspD/PulD (secretin)